MFMRLLRLRVPGGAWKVPFEKGGLMRKFLWATVLLVVGGARLLAEDPISLKDFTFNAYGSFEFHGENIHNEQDFRSAQNDARRSGFSRTRLGLETVVTSDIAGRLEIVRGPNIGGILNSDAQYGTPPRDVNREISNFFVENAYVEVKHFLGVDLLRIGRQYLGRPGDLLVYYGPLNDNIMTVRSLQAIAVKKQFGPLQAQIATAKPFVESAIPQPGPAGDAATELTNTLGGGSVDLYYAFINSDQLFKQTVGKLELEAGVYRGVDKNSPASNDSNALNIYDGRVKFFIPLPWGTDVIALSAEAALNDGADRGTEFDAFAVPLTTTTGVRRNYNGHAYVVKAAYDWRAVVTTHGLYASSSGDRNPGDHRIDGFRDFASVGRSPGASFGSPGSDFRYGKIYHDNANLGFGPGLDTSAYGDFGVELLNLGVEVTPPWAENRLTFTMDFFDARTGVEIPDGAPRRIMQELDAAVRYKHSPNATLELGAAQLHPFDRLQVIRSAALGRTVNGHDKILMAYFNVTVKFGLPEELLSY